MSEYIGLVTQAQSQDQHQRADAFNELMQLFQGIAFRYAYSTLGDAHNAENVTQDAFLSVYQNIDQLREPLAFPAWLKRIVYKHCDRILRRNQPATEQLESRFDLASDSPNPEEVVEQQEISGKLQAAIQALPEKERMVTERFYLDGESQKEIADHMNLPLTTVKKRLQYARKRLKGLIDEANLVVVMFIVGFFPQPQTLLQVAPVPIDNEYQVISESEYSTYGQIAWWDQTGDFQG